MAEPMVVDSSVAAKWFLRDEDDVDLADELVEACLAGDVELHAPGVFTYEVCSALASACRRRPPRLDAEKAAQCVRDLFSLPIRIAEATEEEGVEATRLSAAFSKSFYDMTYIRLAGRLGCSLCTADIRLARSTTGEFPSDRILPLPQLPSALP